MCDCCGTWPEQNAVDAWFEKHGIEVEHKVRLELKEAVTECRLRIQKERDDLRARLQAAEARERALRECISNALPGAMFVSCEYRDHKDADPTFHCCNWNETVKQFQQALSTPPPARWEAMQRVVEAAEGLCKTAAGAYNPKRTSISKVVFIKLKDALAALEGGGDKG
jgi:hypothetical protein